MEQIKGKRQGLPQCLPQEGNRVKNNCFSGGIFPINGTKFKAPELGPVAIMAVNDINNDPRILPRHRLVLDIQDGQCEADVVMKKFIDFIKNKDPSRFRSTVGILGMSIYYKTI